MHVYETRILKKGSSVSYNESSKRLIIENVNGLYVETITSFICINLFLNVV